MEIVRRIMSSVRHPYLRKKPVNGSIISPKYAKYPEKHPLFYNKTPERRVSLSYGRISGMSAGEEQCCKYYFNIVKIINQSANDGYSCLAFSSFFPQHKQTRKMNLGPSGGAPQRESATLPPSAPVHQISFGQSNIMIIQISARIH